MVQRNVPIENLYICNMIGFAALQQIGCRADNVGTLGAFKVAGANRPLSGR
jgi:hypothetical protein